MLIRLQTCHRQAAQREDQRRDQVQAQEADRIDRLCSGEARRDTKLIGHEWSCKDRNHDRRHRSKDKRDIQDVREEVPGFAASLFGQHFG